ncbi:hypothetical protein B296_00040239, partial [Ensete ventricosum]
WLSTKMTAARPPTTPASKIERIPIYTPGRSRIKEEKIFVTVRVRPLSKKELSLKDQEAWACVDDNKIVFKMSAQDRSNSSSSYTFDKVFGPACLTERVYEGGAKDVALSALTGINEKFWQAEMTSLIEDKQCHVSCLNCDAKIIFTAYMYFACLSFATILINQVVSDKQLVKQLQKEVARLEAELRTPEPRAGSEVLLMEKELKIKQVLLLLRKFI